MNIYAKRIITALLLSCLLLSVVSCSSKQTPNKAEATTVSSQTEPPETEETKILPDLPDLTFEGTDFRFYQYQNGDDYPDFNDIWVEDQNGEPINDAVFTRNSMIQEKYDINIKFSTDNYITYETNVKKYANSNENAFEVMLSMGHDIPRLYTSNVFYNLHNIDYLDFTKPWWDQNCVENFTLAGYMPFVVSDMIINDKAVTAAVYYNKKLATDYGVGSLYDIVYAGDWTIDKMIEAGKKVSDDLDGSQTFDDNDRYGIVCSDDPVFMLFHSAGCRYITKDADGYPQLSFESEYNYTVISYYLENLMYDEKLTRNNSFVPNSLSSDKMFEQDQGLFLFGTLGTSQKLREMESDFGIIPIPKYQASQENYSSSVSVFEGSLISVPITTQETEMIGVILEAMAAESQYTLIPAFYNTVLKDKSTRDPESEDMLDIIINNMVFDVGDYYSLASFPDYFLRITGSVYNNNVDKSYPQRTSDMSSFYAKYEKKLNKALTDLIKIIDKWNEM